MEEKEILENESAPKKAKSPLLFSTIGLGAATLGLLVALIISLAGGKSSDGDASSITVGTDGYLVVNGVKTEYEVKDNNHSFGEWKLYDEDRTDCEKNLFYRTCQNCSSIEWKEGSYEDHSFKTATTAPTCTAGGFDTKTCEACGKVETLNETPAVEHVYSSEYSGNNSYHWKKCESCDDFIEKEEHTLGEDGNCPLCGILVAATEGIVYDVSADGTYAVVVDYNGSATNVRIAEEYNGLPVKSVFNEAFRESKAIVSIIIPDSIESIGYEAFYGCTSLTSVVIPDSVTSVGYRAFYGCTSLTSAVIGDGVTSIGYEAFRGCNSLASVDIGDSVTGIGDGVFYDCNSLTSVVIGGSVTSIGDSAFYSCDALTSVIIGDSVTSIGEYAFQYCSELTSVVIGSGVTSIGEVAFSNCNPALYTEYEYGRYVGDAENPYAVLIELTNGNLSTYTINENTKVIASYVFYECPRLTNIKIPGSVKGISSYAFSCCDLLTSVEIADGVETVGEHAFSGCASLTDIVIPNSVSTVGEWAFSNCTSLTSVVIGGRMSHIGNYAFYKCDSLNDVYYTESEEEWYLINIGSNNSKLKGAAIHYNYVPEE